MKTKALICAAASIAFLGCATGTLAQQSKADQPKADLFARAYGAKLCEDKGRCLVMVKVGAACSFTVTPWTLGLLSGNRNVKIHWVLEPSSVGKPEFAKDGIFFKSDTSAKEFDTPQLVSKTEFTWNDKNEPGKPKARPHAYGIKVIQGGKPCPPLDPTIVNDF